MGLTNEHVGPKILAKIKIYVLTRAELLFTLCYEIPCITTVLSQLILKRSLLAAKDASWMLPWMQKRLIETF